MLVDFSRKKRRIFSRVCSMHPVENERVNDVGTCRITSSRCSERPIMKS